MTFWLLNPNPNGERQLKRSQENRLANHHEKRSNEIASAREARTRKRFEPLERRNQDIELIES